MSSVAQTQTRDKLVLERLILILAIGGAAGLGAFAATASPEWVLISGSVGVLVTLAWTLPQAWAAMVLAILVPFQLYLGIPGTGYYLRAAFVFVLVLTVRVLNTRSVRFGKVAVAAVIFLAAALFGSLGAQDRYLAFKGIYDWLPVFGCMIVAASVCESNRTVRILLTLLILGGVVQAAIGLAQFAVGLDATLDGLRFGISELVYNPNLLRERLTDLSFNWIIFDRAAPFGTFINGIDYAVFLGAILSVVLGWLAMHDGAFYLGTKGTMSLVAGGLTIAAALLLTFKGTGYLSFAAGAATVGVLLLRKNPGRVILFGLVVILCAAVLAAPLVDLLAQRLTFLVQREQGIAGTVGRLEIWAQLVQFVAGRPLFGYGLNNATFLSEPTRTLSGGAIAFVATSPESAYLALLVETGIIGFIALISVFAATISQAWRRHLDQNASASMGVMLAGVVAILAGNLTVSGLTTDQNGMLLGMLMGMIWGPWNRQ